jgi:hypothetical protein
MHGGFGGHGTLAGGWTMKLAATLSADLARNLRRMEAYRLIDVLIMAGLTALVVLQVASAAARVA